jgi:hypothetical protein
MWGLTGEETDCINYGCLLVIGLSNSKTLHLCPKRFRQFPGNLKGRHCKAAFWHRVVSFLSSHQKKHSPLWRSFKRTIGIISTLFIEHVIHRFPVVTNTPFFV